MEKDYGSKEDCALGSNPSCPPQPNLGEASTVPSKQSEERLRERGKGRKFSICLRLAVIFQCNSTCSMQQTEFIANTQYIYSDLQ